MPATLASQAQKSPVTTTPLPAGAHGRDEYLEVGRVSESEGYLIGLVGAHAQSNRFLDGGLGTAVDHETNRQVNFVVL